MMNVKEIRDLVIKIANDLTRKSSKCIKIGESFTFRDLVPTDGSVIPTSEISKVSRQFSTMVKNGEVFGIVKSDKKIRGITAYIRTGYRIALRVNPKNKELGILHDVPGLRSGDTVEIAYYDTLGNDYNSIKVSLVNNKRPIILKEIHIGQDSRTNSLYKSFIDYTEKDLYEMSLDPKSGIPNNINADVYDHPITGSKQYDIRIMHKFGVENSESINIWTNSETYKSGFVADINEERIRYSSYIKAESDED